MHRNGRGHGNAHLRRIECRNERGDTLREVVDGDSQRRHYPHASQPMGMFRIRDSPISSTLCSSCGFSVSGMNLSISPAIKIPPKKARAVIRLPRVVLSVMTSSLLTRTEKQLHERYVYHHSGGKPQGEGEEFRIGLFGKKGYRTSYSCGAACHQAEQQGLTYVFCHHFVIGAVTVGTLFKNPAKFPGAYGVFAFIITFATDVRQEFLPAQKIPVSGLFGTPDSRTRTILLNYYHHAQRKAARQTPRQDIRTRRTARGNHRQDRGAGSPNQCRLRRRQQGHPPFVGVLNGAFMFFAELLQRISFPCEVSFVRLSSYHGTTSTGSVTEVFGLRENIEARHVIVVEDIVETGESIRALTDSLAAMNPATLEVATLLFKPASYRNYFPIRYPAMEISDGFIVGFGLDYDGLGRNLCDIYRLAKEV